MRIYYSAEFDGIRIEGVQRSFLPQSLSYTDDSGVVSIWEGGTVKVAQLDWSDVEDEDGSSFTESVDALAHLSGAFSRAPAAANVDAYDPGDLALLFQSS